MEPVNKRKREKTVEEQPQLLKAVEFCSVAQKKGGDDTATHIRLNGNWAIAYNRELVAGHPINETISCCPESDKLLKALKKVKSTLSVTVDDEDQILEINCDGSVVKIPTIQHAQVNAPTYAAPEFGLTPEFKKSIKLLDKITKKSGDTIYEVTACLSNNSAMATDNEVVIEAWHGLQITPAEPLVVGKPFLSAVAKCSKEPVSIGSTKEFVTVFYEDGSFISGFRYDQGWEDVFKPDVLFANCTEQEEISTKFLKALSFCLEFSDDGTVFTGTNTVNSDKTMSPAATVQVPGVASLICLNKAQIKFITDSCTGIKLDTEDKYVHVFGDGFRGVIEK